MRRKIALAIVGLFLLIDALAWVATYRAATAPSPEELQLQAGATPLAARSIVEARGDGMTAQVSLNGEWRYRQTGSELAGYFSPDLDTGGWHTMAIPYSQAELRWRVEGSGGEPVKDGVAVVNVPSDGVRWAAALRNLDLPPGVYDVQVELHDAQGRELGRNGFAFAIEPPEEEKEEAAEK